MFSYPLSNLLRCVAGKQVPAALVSGTLHVSFCLRIVCPAFQGLGFGFGFGLYSGHDLFATFG
jgi:hypothetical protein